MATSWESADEELPMVTGHHVEGRVETEEALASLPVESQAALRQFSLQRTMGYGVDYADAVELRARVLDGQKWQEAAAELGAITHWRSQNATSATDGQTTIAYLLRSSALLRMSQMMMLTDTDERRAIFAEAADRHGQAAELRGDRDRITLETPGGRVAGWLIRAHEDPVASVIVIGGIEGWAMDFDTVGEAFAARGVDALMLDGPGQGETRMTHHHYLTSGWRDAYAHAIGFLDALAPGRPIGFVGNSMGGSFAMAVAAGDERIRACVNNGGVPQPWIVPPDAGTFFTKKVTFCGTDDQEHSVAAWRTVTPLSGGANSGYPLLVVHGGRDPLVSTESALTMLRSAPTEDKEMQPQGRPRRADRRLDTSAAGRLRTVKVPTRAPGRSKENR